MLGGLLAWLGLALLFESLRLARRGMRVEGMVVALEGGYPVVEYMDALGITQRIRLRVSTGKHREGEAIRLRIDTARPEKSRIDTFWFMWLFAILLPLIAMLMLGAAAAVMAFDIPITLRVR
jgi:hypothetical protein